MIRAHSIICDFDRPADKDRLWQAMKALTGCWRITITRWRPRRSDPQNRWYWGCIVQAFFEFLQEQEYEILDAEQAHEILKAKFLTVDVVSRRTGDVIGKRIRSTAKLSTAEFADYCERCRAYLADFFHIVVPDPITTNIELCPRDWPVAP